MLNGVDVERFYPPEVAPDSSEILFTGQVAPHKGPDIAVKAAAITRQPIHLKVVGSSVHGHTDEISKYEKKLRFLAQKATRRGSRILFEAFLPHSELPEVYREAGIMLVPSRFREPFGLVCLEAMASGAAIIVANRGGLPNLCGSAGLIVDPNAGAFAEALNQLTSNPEEYRSLRLKSRERALLLTWKNQFRQLMAVIGEAGTT